MVRNGRAYLKILGAVDLTAPILLSRILSEEKNLIYFKLRFANIPLINRIVKTNAATRKPSRTAPNTEEIKLKVLIISTSTSGSYMGSARKTQISIYPSQKTAVQMTFLRSEPAGGFLNRRTVATVRPTKQSSQIQAIIRWIVQPPL